MSALKAGDSFPEGVSFTYVPPSPDKAEITSCGIPIKYDASQEFKDKKIVLVSVPGAFTPTCQEQHVVSYIRAEAALRAKGVDHVVFIAYNDPFVMSAWGKANGVTGDFILFMSDADTAFSQKLGWTVGVRTARYAIAIDHGKVVYAELEEVPKSIAKTGAEAVLAAL